MSTQQITLSPDAPAAIIAYGHGLIKIHAEPPETLALHHAGISVSKLRPEAKVRKYIMAEQLSVTVYDGSMYFSLVDALAANAAVQWVPIHGYHNIKTAIENAQFMAAFQDPDAPKKLRCQITVNGSVALPECSLADVQTTIRTVIQGLNDAKAT